MQFRLLVLLLPLNSFLMHVDAEGYLIFVKSVFGNEVLTPLKIIIYNFQFRYTL